MLFRLILEANARFSSILPSLLAINNSSSYFLSLLFIYIYIFTPPYIRTPSVLSHFFSSLLSRSGTQGSNGERIDSRGMSANVNTVSRPTPTTTLPLAQSLVETTRPPPLLWFQPSRRRRRRRRVLFCHRVERVSRPIADALSMMRRRMADFRAAVPCQRSKTLGGRRLTNK